MHISLRCGLLAATLLFALPGFSADSDRDHWVARQGSATLTLGDVDARVLDLPEDKRLGFINSPTRIEETLRDMLLIRQLADEARKEGLDKDPMIELQLKLVTDRILAEKRVAQLRKSPVLGDLQAQAKEAYLSNPTAYAELDTIDVRQILISPSCSGETEARALAIKLRDQIAKGASIEQLAKQYSDDKGTKENGGLISGLTRGKTEAGFEDAAFKLQKPGDLSDVVRSSYGFHVIQLVKRVDGKPRKFEQVQDKIVETLRTKRQDTALREHTDELRSKSLDADEATVASLRTRYGEVQSLPAGEGDPALQKPAPTPPPGK